MIPVKPQESSSRRSSILKPPKSRHPLQFVDFNSSPENSPTTKQTRRVSFAEKKHVKEFVDSVERGTLWDNTYEENEFGSGKSVCSSQCENIDNVENQNPVDEDSYYSIHKVAGINESVQPNHLAQLETAKTFMRELTAGCFTSFCNDKNELGSFQNECDISQEECDLDLINTVDGIKTTEVTEQMNNLDNYTMHRQPHVYNNKENEIETTNINKTICHDMSMELTTAIPFCISSHPGTSNTSCTTSTQEKQYSNPSSQSYLEGINIRSNTIRSNLNNSIDLENKTMDLTTAVTSQDPFSQFILNKENINHLPYTEGNTEDSFMEYVAPVERTTNFANQSMIFTECIPSKHILKLNTKSAGKIYESRDYIDELHQDKPNLTLDFNKQNCTDMEKTKIFFDTSIEMTNAVRTAIETRDSEKSDKRNETLGNMSMEMTTVISQAKSLIKADDNIDKMNRSAKHENFNVAKNILPNKVNVDQTISERTEKTKCFQNMPMELTTLVSTHVPNNNLTDNIKLPHKKRDYLEYLEYCQETGNKRTKEYLEATKTVEENKTEMFKDMSMEITSAIPLTASMVQGKFVQNFDNSVLQSTLVEPVEQFIVTNDKDSRDNVNRTTRNNDQELDTESNVTKLFKNVPMEMTTTIRQTAPIFQEDVSSSSTKIAEENKTEMFKNMSMEITSAIPLTASMVQGRFVQNFDNSVLQPILVEPVKQFTVTNDKDSRDNVNRTTRNNDQELDTESNVTKLFKNVPMEMTTTIRQTAPIFQEDVSSSSTKIAEENKTEMFKDMSMEITSAIPLTASMVQGRFVQNFDNSVLQPILVEPVEQFTVTNDKDSRDNVNRTTRNNDQELDTESNMTKLFKNVPMEMTTTIRQTVPTFQEDVSLSSKNYKEQEKLVKLKDTDDIIEHQEITNTVTENVCDKMIVEPRKSILMGNTSMEQETGISESPFNSHPNCTYNIKKPRICHNLSETVGKIAATLAEDNRKKDTAHMSINNEAINENRLLENESMDITNRIAITAEAPVKNVSIRTETCVNINQAEQLSINTPPTTRTYVIRRGCCTQVNESVVNDTDIVMGCEEVCINKSDSDRGNISIYNSEPIHADNSILSDKINAAEVINKDTSNMSVIGDEMCMTDIENRPTCLISNDSYEEKNESKSDELSSSEKKELIYSEENHKRILPISTEENEIVEVSMDIRSHNDVVEDPFVTWMNSINAYSVRDDCIWNVRCLNEKIFALDFISSSLVVVMHFEKVENRAINNFQRINIISRLKDEADPILRLVHRIILDKINPESLIKTYCMPDDFFPLMEHISRDVIFAMDFMFEYKRLYNMAMVDIIDKRIQFTVWTKTMNMMLNVSIEINSLNSISLNEVEVEPILGSIRVDDIKKLIVNAKKDHRYLSRCINDVKEYLTWMEITG